MANTELIVYSIASFTCALFVLEFGADKFIDHTVIVAKRTGVAQTLIALLTAGAEWEELAVVVICIARGRSSLAAGNIVGSAISNILGAFSLGLVTYRSEEQIVFDQSARLYSVLLLVLTVLVVVASLVGQDDQLRVFGSVAIAVFVVYIGSIAWAIRKGRMAAPELSDSDSDGDSESDGDSDIERTADEQRSGAVSKDATATSATIDRRDSLRSTNSTQEEAQPLLGDSDLMQYNASRQAQFASTQHRGQQHGLLYHIFSLLLGLLAILLSSFVLSHSASTFTTAVGISDFTFGIVVLSLATTLPEKLISVLSGFRGHGGILVANTVGSNIFLLSLCLGIWWVWTDGQIDGQAVGAVELGVLAGATLAMVGVVWTCGRWSKAVGWVMLGGYVVFLVLECTVIRRT